MTELAISHYKPYFANRIISDFVIMLKLTRFSHYRNSIKVLLKQEQHFCGGCSSSISVWLESWKEEGLSRGLDSNRQPNII